MSDPSAIGQPCERCERLEKLIRQLGQSINALYSGTPQAQQQYREMIEEALR